MFYAMNFIPTGFNNNVTVRSVRTKPYKSFESAVKALIATKREGYIKEAGKSRPIWHNLPVH